MEVCHSRLHKCQVSDSYILFSSSQSSGWSSLFPPPPAPNCFKWAHTHWIWFQTEVAVTAAQWASWHSFKSTTRWHLHPFWQSKAVSSNCYISPGPLPYTISHLSPVVHSSLLPRVQTGQRGRLLRHTPTLLSHFFLLAVLNLRFHCRSLQLCL